MVDRLSLAIALVGLTACGAAAPSPSPPLAPAPEAPAAVATLGGEIVFRGMCDASGAVSLSAREMVAADDEDNVLRMFDVEAGGDARWSADVSAALGVPMKGKKAPRPAEVDLEAATVLGDRAYWISSHGRNSKGKRKPERLRFFATTVPTPDAPASMVVVGSYDRLLDDLLADPRYARFGLDAASALPPKEAGGLNIEGLTMTPEGTLLIGFRNPIPADGALIAPLLNAAALIDGSATVAAFGDPVQLDLGGHGVRAMSWWRGRYLVIAGAASSDGAPSRLYTWDGRTAPRPVAVDLAAYNPEGFFSPEDRDELLLLSDDGSRLVGELPCKEAEPAVKAFRGVWLRLTDRSPPRG